MANAVRTFTVEALSLLGVSIVVILFRTYTRVQQVGFRQLAPDDWLMLLVIIPYSIETSMAYLVGNVFRGISNSAMTPEQRADLDPASEEYSMRVGGSKSQVTGWVMYTTVLWVIKAALCAFYLRLTTGLPAYKTRIYAGFVIILTTYIAVICSLLFSCHPFHRFWQINPDPGNFCQSAASRVYIFTVVTFNIATDVYLLLIPLPILWQSQIPKAKKIGLMILFSGGIFVMVAGILRAVLIIQNPETGALQSASWAVRESFVALVTSNVPITWGWLRQKLSPMFSTWLSTIESKYGSRPEPGSIILEDTRNRPGWCNQDTMISAVTSRDKSSNSLTPSDRHSDTGSTDDIITIEMRYNTAKGV
ncbi:hypothetical protein FSST1_000151 [Fusarium sambucinum]